MDGRRRDTKRFEELKASLISELGGALTSGDVVLVAQCAALMVRAEAMQIAIVSGDASVRTDDVVRVSNAAARLLAVLGEKIRRRGRDAAPPDLNSILDEIARADSETAAGASDGEGAV